ncbi:mannose-1-phosphate guanylyltransferase/mannose-6-phosphate isomerase [Prochlorococcus marinus str. MU1404]|uniref:mannose-1-phosphate guanylyltransferase/mannose-6-phosphate isomerase n=1 Tax=Prochlorococcus marinus TaxID=1219 RepID=UPI001ADA0D4F|nr:mannose-1-phosphate guanylyltransferase/mannose-6-phosphate isomerase [Prochlorococcus marinus]MBO8230559.1 mannose-1-phosphate guanylyltransferase/mannose-6-phosphate isomerase [Prochlorococcus marinus XMU1404]MBW3073605.1 mannose-1-phosphate guanylyltransferase/mannose-6-phosphate isomerase [Prochlorococcus marinus str. MU1404]MCR8545108.1 mannose-1-phosphate guanylyltransferase/mannose-6-phosphate isomerase [Prochlorococcus marinus CUG1432]
MESRPIIPVILCGGSGTRLWPLSRKSFPKQFLSLSSNSNKSLLQLTQERIKNIKGIQQPILICNEEHRFLVAEQMREIDINPMSILLEPFGRNTCPAITLAALKAIEVTENPILLILSSDHIIEDDEKFKQVIEAGLNYVEKDKLVTFGIVPTSPETGYGYIKSTESKTDLIAIGSKIESFVEKPNLEKAKEFIKDKRYTWNSGMFLFKAETIIKEIKHYSPEIFNHCSNALKDELFDLDFQRLNKEDFSKCPNISIDFAVMEKTNLGVVLPLNAGWNDIGSWDSVWEISKKDKYENVIEGNVLAKDTRNSYLRSDKRLLAAIGIEDIIVVETSDAILVASKSKSQEVKEIVAKLKDQKIPEGQEHKKIYRPWGFYESIVEDSRWKVKLINVIPGEKLSLQLHHHRSEHWIVVKGTAKVEVDKSEMILNENQSTYIPLGSKHRLSNPGEVPLLLIEVQSGSYLGEDDIERFEDSYGRI